MPEHQYERGLGKHDPPLIMPASDVIWRETAWNGVVFRLPGSWQPAVIRKSYLFFEHRGQPAFAVKWEQVRGRFSAGRILKRLQRSFRQAEAFLPWEVPAGLSDMQPNHALTGFQCRDGNETILGILLFCSHCRRAAILLLYTGVPDGRETMRRILHTYADHHEKEEQTWAVYDIRAQLPVRAELKSHEFLAGLYHLSFALDNSIIDLYRFKPAAAILQKQNLRAFCSPLAGDAAWIGTGDDRIAVWEYTASGIARLAVLSGRKPGWIWLRAELAEDQNAILAVRGSGRKALDRKLMEHIAGNFSVTEVV